MTEQKTQSAVENSAVSGNPNPTETPKTSPKKSNIFRRTFIATGLLFGLAIGGSAAMIGTETGTKWALDLTQKMVSGLRIGEFSGSLQKGLLLRDVEFHSDAVQTQLKQAHLQLDFGCLLNGEICVQDIQLHQSEVKIDTSHFAPSEPQKETPSEPMQRLSLPLGFSIKNIQIENLALQIDQQKIELGQFKSAVSLNHKSGLTLSPTQIENLTLTNRITEQQAAEQKRLAQRQAQIKAKQAKPIDWTAIENALTPAFLGEINEIILPFDIHIDDLQGKNLNYRNYIGEQETQLIEVPNVHIQADAVDDKVELKTLQVKSSLGNLDGKGRINLSNEMPLNLALQGDIAEISGEADNGEKQMLWAATQGEIALTGELKNITYITAKTQGEINAELIGQVELNRDKMPLQLKLTSSSAQYPFIKDDPLKIKNVTLNVTGDLLDYQATLQGEMAGLKSPAAKVDLKGSGKIYQVNLEKLAIQGLKGQLDLTGDVSWKNGVTWQSAVDLKQINLADYLSTFPAVLSGQFVSKGDINSERWQIDFSTLNLQGHLHQRPMKLTGSASIGNKDWINADNLAMSYGENKLLAQGVLSQKSDFKLNINAPNLRGLLPNLSANIVGKVQLTGTAQMPNVDMDLVGNQVQFQDFRLNKFNAKGKINSDEILQGDFNISAEGFQYGDNIRLNSFSLVAQGDEKNHRLTLRSKGEPLAANLNLVGNFDRALQQWKGLVTQSDIQFPAGAVKNAQFNMSYNNTTQDTVISAHCWNGADLELCFPTELKLGANGKIPFQLKKFDLNIANKLLEKEWFKGRLNSQGEFAWYSDKPIKLDMQVKGDNLQFAQTINYRNFQLNASKLDFNSKIENNNLTAKANISLQNQGNINAEVGIQDLIQSRKLTGLFKVSGVNLDLLNQLLGRSENISGDVVANLNFAGDLTAPLLNGNFSISKMKAQINAMPFAINNGELALRFTGNHSTLTGYIQSPESRLNLTGNASWQNVSSWKTEVNAKADEFYVNIPSLAQIKISPNVIMRADPTALELDGNVDIPWARVEVESLPESAASLSSDEVILDGKTDRKILRLPAKTQNGLAIKSDLKINIGNDVTVNAYGLNSHLQGGLLVKQAQGALGLYGVIDMKNGRYASFGQDLLIQKGQITFNGLPSQPMLNIEAVRNSEAMEDSNIVAGVKVNGLADAPDVTVFSNPSMSQDQALSYLLTGRSLENSGDAGSSGSIGAALLGLGLSKSGKVVGKIGETFGISDLNLGTAGVGDNSKVVVSGNLTKDLQIKYGVGLFNGLAEVTLRYRLLPQLFLQSVSSTEQAVDLLYQFEF